MDEGGPLEPAILAALGALIAGPALDALIAGLPLDTLQTFAALDPLIAGLPLDPFRALPALDALVASLALDALSPGLALDALRPSLSLDALWAGSLDALLAALALLDCGAPLGPSLASCLRALGANALLAAFAGSGSRLAARTLAVAALGFLGALLALFAAVALLFGLGRRGNRE